ncbi:rhomboid family intramembrane serine protease [Flammeovirga yaeyamensis]|uniref:Rhomboid family intramembrane serine protease n=1 Tax=Flammeovirga yaeyamensis TaxID=367791 RepID=A0AAX1N493_9BACT|nr:MULTISPECIES: rhomboid family intramembrane serine protease [Flammeovirga]ANQ50424.2 rhomboid family intramembrane serine protease [Flammeovirga sp. MY04]MBB3699618.1 membrane associated rhomboid family serine protease [Flammeovirga yaeyamensis]NMF36809.1 rhomboid family intramembrane serine protease [Flammeovirga yaeyamensis]QWG02151.1 rhomboid family intramembrane serine protease [Flammeovirga yaeyamensis]
MSITLILIVLNVGISYYAFQNDSVRYKLLMDPYLVASKNQWYRFISSAFVHSSWMHLLFNMLTLYFFGESVERICMILTGNVLYGELAFLALYFGGAIIADIPSYIKHKGDINYRSLGASGAVSSVVFFMIIFAPVQDICLYFVLCLPSFILGAAFLIYSYYQSNNPNTYINHSAHLFGAIWGIAFSILLEPNSIIRFFQQIQTWITF